MKSFAFGSSLGVLFAASFIGLSAAPASADRTDCGSSYLCLWGGSNYSGDPWFEATSTGNYSTGYWNNDESSSVANRSTTKSFYLYAASDQSSREGQACVPRRYSEPRMGDWGWGDRVSSMKVTTAFCPEGLGATNYLGTRKD